MREDRKKVKEKTERMKSKDQKIERKVLKIINEEDYGKFTIDSKKSFKKRFKKVDKIGNIASIEKDKSTNMLYVFKKIFKKEGDEINIKKEIRCIETFSHPCICKYINSFEDERNHILVTEYYSGGSLLRVIKEHEKNKILIPEYKIRYWLGQTVSALNYLHVQDYIHRDIKPANIVLDEYENIRLIDFGIIKDIFTNPFMTIKMGTPAYQSPENLKGDQYGFETDIWSLGCTFYELCTLKRAFGPNTLDSNEIKKDILNPEYLPAPIDSKIYSQEMISIIGMMLNRNIKERIKARDLLNFPYLQNLQVEGVIGRSNNLESKRIIKIIIKSFYYKFPFEVFVAENESIECGIRAQMDRQLAIRCIKYKENFVRYQDTAKALGMNSGDSVTAVIEPSYCSFFVKDKYRTFVMYMSKGVAPLSVLEIKKEIKQRNNMDIEKQHIYHILKEESKDELKDKSKDKSKDESKDKLKDESKDESKDKLKDESKDKLKDELLWNYYVFTKPVFEVLLELREEYVVQVRDHFKEKHENFQVVEQQTVGTLRKMITEKLKLKENSFALYFKSRILDDKRDLKYYEINEFAIITMIKEKDIE